MKSRISFPTLISAGAILLMAGLAACSGLFTDPLKDKDTGEKVTVLLLDRNFIKTKMNVRLVDKVSQEAIEGESVEVRFSGDDAAHLITFGGTLQTNFSTASGFVEIGVDPNIPLDADHPLELTVIAVSPHYISVPQFVSFTADGIKNLKIEMLRIGDKSVNGSGFDEPYDVSFNGSLHSSQLHFVADISGSPTGTDWNYLNMYSTASAGNLECSNLKDNVLYSDYGAYYFGASSLMPPANPSKSANLGAGDIVYTSILKTGMTRCGQGLVIHASRSDGKSGSAVLDYEIAFSDGSVKSGQLTFTFPGDNLVEPIYYPAAGAAVTVTLRGDAQYTVSEPVSLASPCGATANFVVTPKSNLQAYKLITQYTCPDSPVGLGLSITGEFRKSGTTDPWTTFEFVEGICELQLEAGADYDFRVNIDSEYYEYTLPTDVNRIRPFLEEHQNEDYRLISLDISQGEDLVTVTASVELSQGICDKLN